VRPAIRLSICVGILALLAAACGGASATKPPTAAPSPAATIGPAVSSRATPAPTAAGATTAAAATEAAGASGAAGASTAAEGGDVVRVVMTGGANPGTFTGGDDPHCTVGIIGPDGWGVQWSLPDATAGQLSSVQLVSAARGHEDDPKALFQGTSLLLTVGFGPILQATDYVIQHSTDETQDKGAGSVEVQDNGDKAVIHATGTTADGVRIDALVNCPSVTRV
jgi:hypothetical protein